MNSNKLNIIKNLEQYIYFDGVLNILSLLFDIKKVSRIENINNISMAIDILNGLGFLVYKKGEETLYVAKNNENLNLGVYNDIEKNNAYNFGKLLGFPDCCIEEFMNIGGVSEKKMFNFLKEISNKDNSNNYLNFFENKLIYHLPCSMNCRESIKIGKKVYEIYNILHKNNNDFFSKKIYIVFKDLQWIKIENNNYSFGGLIKDRNTRYKNKIKKGYKIRIISNNEIILYNDTNTEIFIENVIIFNFV